MDTPALLGSQCKEKSHGLHPCHGSKGIVEVDPLLLHETSCHKASLVLDNGAGFIPLQPEHPLKGDRAVTAREIGKLPGAVLPNHIHLRLHRGTTLPRVPRPLRKTEARRRRTRGATAPPGHEAPDPASANRQEGPP